jgi:alpha-1,2-mannosyltransferase
MIRQACSAGISVIRDARWMTPDRARAYCNIVLAATTLGAIGWIGLALARGGIDLYGKPIGEDFISFWTASRIALSGSPAAVYDVDTHWAAQRALFDGAPLHYTAFFYPPVFLLICLPLGLLPYGWSLIAWLGVTGCAYWAAIRRLAGQSNMALPILAFPAVYWNAMYGQNGFLTTALFASALSTLETRPILAGICFGCLSYKPHLAIVVPFGLIAARRWTTLAVAGVTAVALCIASIAVFGLATWQAFLSDSALARVALEQNLVGNEKMQSVFAAVRLLGGGMGIAYALHVAVALTIVALLMRLCRAVPIGDGGGAAMAAASLMASPFVLGYDLMLLAIPLVWLLREAVRTDFLPWEKTVLLAGFLLPLISSSVADRLHLPLAPLVIMALFMVIYRRAAGATRSGAGVHTAFWSSAGAMP